MVNSKALRISLYILTPALVAILPLDAWRQTIPSEAEALGGAMIALGIVSILYGWLFVGRVLRGIWDLSGELEKQVGQVLCFEAGTIFTVAGVLFLIRHYASQTH